MTKVIKLGKTDTVPVQVIPPPKKRKIQHMFFGGKNKKEKEKRGKIYKKLHKIKIKLEEKDENKCKSGKNNGKIARYSKK